MLATRKLHKYKKRVRLKSTGYHVSENGKKAVTAILMSYNVDFRTRKFELNNDITK